MSDTAAAILKASAEARAQLNVLDSAARERLATLYQQIVAQLQQDLRAYGDATDSVRVEVLSNYLRQANARLTELGAAQRNLLQRDLLDAATLGAQVWAAVLPAAALPLLADAALRFVNQFVAADGLKLSDRLWRIDNGAKQAIADVLRRNVVMGRDATRAGQELLALGQPIPLDVQARLGLDRVGKLGAALDQALTTDPNNAYSHALRVFRTELNRAHGEAYQAGAGQHPDVIGMQFCLSPNHPRPDICDTLASANAYGLGPGVYPVGKAPWPAHPNTMSYLVAVFRKGNRFS